MVTPFDPEPIAHKESASDACARVIRAAIVSGELGAGTKLPPERDLARSLGVNRLTLRNALAQLGVAGLISVKQGSGYTVLDYQRAGGLDLLPALVRLSAERGDVAGFAAELLLLRRHVAAAVLERASEKATPESIARLRNAVDEFERVIDATTDSRKIASADLGVVAALLDATQSSVLMLCLNPVLSVIASFEALRDAIYAEPLSNVAAYRLLVAWLQSSGAKSSGPIVDELAQRDAATLLRLSRRKS